jgi:NADH-quinone oxidoreductase subunit C
MEKEKVLTLLGRRFPGRVREVPGSPGDDEVAAIDRQDLLEVAGFLKTPPQDFAMLLDLTCVDYAPARPRFEMVYHFFSLSDSRRLRLKVRLEESDPRIASLASLWKNADWLEREVFDLFGVEFEGHPNLRRLFMYDGFEGHPLRKDYPLRKRQPIFRMRE